MTLLPIAFYQMRLLTPEMADMTALKQIADVSATDCRENDKIAAISCASTPQSMPAFTTLGP